MSEVEILKEFEHLFGETKPYLSVGGRTTLEALDKMKSVRNIKESAQEAWKKAFSSTERRRVVEQLRRHMLRWGVCRGPTTEEWDPEERFLTDHMTRDFLTTVAKATKYMGSSYEDNAAYELEDEVTDMVEFLRRAGVEDVTAIESNDTELSDELFGMDVAYSDLYDPIWDFYVVVGIREKLLILSCRHLFRRRELYELFEDEVWALAGLFFSTFGGDAS